MWSELLRKTGQLLRDPLSHPQFAAQAQSVAQQLGEAVVRDPDIGAFELMHTAPATRCCIRCRRPACARWWPAAWGSAPTTCAARCARR